MLDSVLRTRADELAPLAESTRAASTVFSNQDQLIRTESNLMLMDGVMGCIGQAYQRLEDHEQLATIVARAERMLMQLNASMTREVGGEFAQELGELCDFVGQQLKSLLTSPRKALLDMASNIMNQVSLIWEQGVSQYLNDAIEGEDSVSPYHSAREQSTAADSVLLH